MLVLVVYLKLATRYQIEIYEFSCVKLFYIFCYFSSGTGQTVNSLYLQSI